MRELSRVGFDSVAGVGHSACEEILSSFNAQPIARLVPWPPYSSDALCGDVETFLAHGNIGAEDLGVFLTDARPNDVVVLYTASENELYAFAKWLETREVSQRPFLVANVSLPSFFKPGSVEPNLRGRLLRTAIRRIEALLHPHQRVYVTLTDPMARALAHVTGVQFDVLPNPIDLSAFSRESQNLAEQSVIRIACPGQPKGTKGAGILPEIVEKASEFNCTFVVQNWPLKMEPPLNVEVLPTSMGRTDYVNYLNRCDITLLPYDTEFYTLAVSAVFDEVASAGHGVITTTGTWMSEYIDQGIVSGKHASEGDIDALVMKLGELIGDASHLRALAIEAGKRWKAMRGVGIYLSTVLDRLQINRS